MMRTPHVAVHRDLAWQPQSAHVRFDELEDQTRHVLVAVAVVAERLVEVIQPAQPANMIPIPGLALVLPLA